MKRVLGLVVAVALAVGGGVALAGPVGAEPTLAITISPEPVAPDSVVTVSGTCPSASPVFLSVRGTMAGGLLTAAGATTLSGDFDVDVDLANYWDGGGVQVRFNAFCSTFEDYDATHGVAFRTLTLPSPPTMALGYSTPRQVYGLPVTLTVTVSPGAMGSLTATVGGASIESDEIYWLGHAKYTLPADLAVGTHPIEVTFDPLAEGDNVTAESTITVVKASTSTALTTSATGWRYGATRPTATATVSPAFPGTVRFTIGGKAIGKPVAVVGGKAKVRLPARTVGKHAVVATFVPAAPGNVLGSRSATRSVKVSKASAVATVKPSVKKITRGAKATVKITVKVKGVKAPTGKVAIYDGRKKIKTVTLKAKHRGKLTVKVAGIKKVGKHKISVRYLGSKNIKADRSPAKNLRVVR